MLHKLLNLTNKKNLIDVSIAARNKINELYDEDLKDAICENLHELERELNFVDQQLRIFINLKQKQNDKIRLHDT